MIEDRFRFTAQIPDTARVWMTLDQRQQVLAGVPALYTCAKVDVLADRASFREQLPSDNMLCKCATSCNSNASPRVKRFKEISAHKAEMQKIPCLLPHELNETIYDTSEC